ncbi:MAG: flagellar hook-basal body complex protein FliE [Oscillospiraceae bacterium]
MDKFFTPIVPIKPMTLFTGGASKTPDTGEAAAPFSNILQDALGQYDSLQSVTEADSNSLAMGTADDLAQIQINSMKSQAALQTTVQLTSRIVGAYKEIMQMQV